MGRDSVQRHFYFSRNYDDRSGSFSDRFKHLVGCDLVFLSPDLHLIGYDP